VRIVEHEDSEFWMALLVVFDSNCRPLLAGVSLFQSDFVKDMFKAIKMILRVHPEVKALITSLYPPLLRVIRNLQELGIFKGLHLIDRESVLEDVKRDLDEIGDKLPESIRA